MNCEEPTNNVIEACASCMKSNQKELLSGTLLDNDIKFPCMYMYALKKALLYVTSSM